MFWVNLTLQWYEDAMVFCVVIFIFCLEQTSAKDTFLEVPYWTLLDHFYVQSPFSTITRHIDNSIFKDTI